MTGTSESPVASEPCEPPPRWLRPPRSWNSQPGAAERMTRPRWGSRAPPRRDPAPGPWSSEASPELHQPCSPGRSRKLFSARRATASRPPGRAPPPPTVRGRRLRPARAGRALHLGSVCTPSQRDSTLSRACPARPRSGAAAKPPRERASARGRRGRPGRSGRGAPRALQRRPRGRRARRLRGGARVLLRARRRATRSRSPTGSGRGSRNRPG